MIKINGAKGEIENIDDFLEKINSFAKENNVMIQVFNSDLIFGEKHLISAFKHAQRAFDTKRNTTNSLEMELLLYAAGERQLKIAIPKMGIKKGNSNIALFFYGNNLDDIVDIFLKKFSLKLDDKLLKGDLNTLKKFGIKDSEIGTVKDKKHGDLILEKVALVDIIK
jgi:KEOPS complex subunit Cgi121